MNCIKCKRDIGDPIASIAFDMLGNETTAGYALCPTCNVWTVDVYYDSFMGDGFSAVRGPVAREVGDADVAAIRQCSTPHSKWCKCPTHQRFMLSTSW
jgi:hypothetical protein